MTNGNNQRGINWGNVPQWVTIFVSIFGIGVSGGWILSDKQNQEEIQELTESVAPLEQQKQNLEQEKQNLEQEKQNLEQEKQNLEQEKQKLDLEIQDLKSEIAQANTEKEKLKDELEKAKQELAKPIDISNRQRSYEFILNKELKPRYADTANKVEMTLDKLLIEKGVGMTLVFTTWNKHQQDSVKSQPHGNSTLTDDLGNEYRLADQVGCGQKQLIKTG